MKRVVSSDQVFHLWAHQAQSDARNGTGSVFFEGDTVYSYRRSWPLARIFKKGPKAVVQAGEYQNVLVLTNANTCSVTTNQHQSSANRAASHLPQVAVPFLSQAAKWASNEPNAWHDANLAYLAKVAADALAKAQRAMQVNTVRYLGGRAADAQSDAERYAKFFGIRRRQDFCSRVTVDWDAARARAERIENPDPVRDAKRIKERERRQASAQRALQAQFDDYCARVTAYNTAFDAALAALPAVDAAQVWRDTGRFPNLAPDVSRMQHPHVDYKQARKFRNAGFSMPIVSYAARPVRDVLLRVQGDEIVTSQGARIPLDHAPRIWKLVQAVMARGEPYARNGHTEHAGAFAIDAIGVDGTLRAGCHTIKYDELERMAKTLSLA